MITVHGKNKFNERFTGANILFAMDENDLIEFYQPDGKRFPKRNHHTTFTDKGDIIIWVRKGYYAAETEGQPQVGIDLSYQLNVSVPPSIKNFDTVYTPPKKEIKSSYSEYDSYSGDSSSSQKQERPKTRK